MKNNQLTINERVKNLEHDITLTKEAIQNNNEILNKILRILEQVELKKIDI